MQCSTDSEQNLVIRQAETLGCHYRLYESVVRRKFSYRFTSHTGNIVLEIWIVETLDNLLYIFEVGLMVEAELLYQSLAALLHRSVHDSVDFRSFNALENGLAALHLAEICCNRMTGVERKQFSLNVCEEVVGHIHSCNFRSFSDERLFLDIPFVVFLHSHVDRILASYRRDNAVNRAVWKTCVRETPLCLSLVEMRKHSFLKT